MFSLIFGLIELIFDLIGLVFTGFTILVIVSFLLPNPWLFEKVVGVLHRLRGWGKDTFVKTES